MDDAASIDLVDRLASELDRASGLLESLATQLCLDPIVFARHAGPLQRFDQVTQIIGEIARFLRSSGSVDDAVSSIRLDAMRERLCDGTR